MEVRGAFIYCVKNDSGLYNVGINMVGAFSENREFELGGRPLNYKFLAKNSYDI